MIEESHSPAIGNNGIADGTVNTASIKLSVRQ
jgi:hypothetical protein